MAMVDDSNNKRWLDYECQKYEAEAPRVYYDRLSALLKDCSSQHSQQQSQTASGCPVCDERFFASLSEEVAAVTRHFSKKVQWLLQIHLASGFKKAVLKVKHKQARNHAALIQEGQNLIKYATTMTLAAHALLEDYDKIHGSREGVHFKAQLVGAHNEFLQSPWLIELLALYFNLENGKGCQSLPELCPGCKCDATNGNLTLVCMPHELLKVEIDTTCPICLETVFEPLALSCGHYFCFSCACSTASVHTYEKLAEAKANVKCPLCRETNAFASAIRLTELNLLTYRRCKDYWKGRRQRERKERMKEIKEYWSYKPEDVGTQTYFV
eukprot:c359_g1_i1 orf=152-1129(+)